MRSRHAAVTVGAVGAIAVTTSRIVVAQSTDTTAELVEQTRGSSSSGRTSRTGATAGPTQVWLGSAGDANPGEDVSSVAR